MCKVGITQLGYPLPMFSQFLEFVCVPCRMGRRSLVATVLGTCSAIAPLVWNSHPAIAETPGFTRSVSTKAEVLQAYPRHTTAVELGHSIATNYNIYCGKTGDIPTEIFTDRVLCDNTAIGGTPDDIPIPVSVTTPEPMWHNSPLQEPMVLQQSDRTQLFPR